MYKMSQKKLSRATTAKADFASVVSPAPKPRQVSAQSLKIRIDDLKTFSPLTENQKTFFESYKNGDYFIALLGSPGVGKAQPLDAKILTPTGWILMGDIDVGNTVIAADGTPTTVTGVYPQGEKDIYEIKFHDGSTTRACGDHLWKVWFTKDKNRTNRQQPHVISTDEIAEILEADINVAVDLYIPPAGEDTILPLPPYLLGALLGDGGLTHHISFTSADEEIVERVGLLLEGDYKLVKRSEIEYSITIPRVTGVANQLNNYKTVLDQMGLYGKKSSEKFIPFQYMLGSLKQKFELIRGLMDTDGTVDKRGIPSYTTTSQQLALDIQQLVWSIGGIASISTRNPTYTYLGEKLVGAKAYTLNIAFKCPKDLFHLNRKKDRARVMHADGRVTLRRRVQSIHLVSTEPAQCIMVDHPDHLYVTDNYIVTHNTFLAVYKALEEVMDKGNGFERVTIIRSAVQVRDVGYTPGSLDEKMAIYEAPYIDICRTLFARNDAWSRLQEQGYVKFMSTTAIRGVTIDNSIIIVDECQSMSWHELNSVISRCGHMSKIIFVGDLKQNDLLKNKHDVSGLSQFLEVAQHMKEFTKITFTPDDIVRSSLVKSWIIACENFDKGAK